MKRYFRVAIFIFVICLCGCINAQQNAPADEVKVNWQNKTDYRGAHTYFEFEGYDFERLENGLTGWFADEDKMTYIGQLRVFGVDDPSERPDDFFLFNYPFLRLNSYTNAYCYYDETGKPLVISNESNVWINSEISLFHSKVDPVFSYLEFGDYHTYENKTRIIEDFKEKDLIDETKAALKYDDMVMIYGARLYSKEVPCMELSASIAKQIGGKVLYISTDLHANFFALNEEWQTKIENAYENGQ